MHKDLTYQLLEDQQLTYIGFGGTSISADLFIETFDGKILIKSGSVSHLLGQVSLGSSAIEQGTITKKFVIAQSGDNNMYSEYPNGDAP